MLFLTQLCKLSKELKHASSKPVETDNDNEKYAFRTWLLRMGFIGPDEKVKEQVLAIRDTGLTNMFDLSYVQRLAFDRNYYDLVLFIEEHRDEYVHFILHGDVR